MKIGIIGLPNVGKSTLFNALTSAGAEAENYPFCTVDPNVGVVTVPDKRLDVLVNMFEPEVKKPVAIEFVDIAGLVEGASRGEGLGNQFLAQIREVNAIAHVVRCFEDSNVSHIAGEIDPLRDIEVINTELMLADLEVISGAKEKTERMTRSGEKKYEERLLALQRMEQILQGGQNLRQIKMNGQERKLVRELQLLTAKPIMYLANIHDTGLQNLEAPKMPDYLKQMCSRAESEGAEVVVFNARIEADLSEFTPEEAKEFRSEMGLEESGLEKIIKAGYSLLDLITFFTVAGGKEVRASTVKRGSTAPEAAGRIHSDMQEGFIRAEVVSFSDLVEAGSLSRAREEGLLRVEGSDYVVADGDVCYFLFNT
ncbi:MAG: redox-regulated ATPase YchF [Halanaerobiaceae bacterium]